MEDLHHATFANERDAMEAAEEFGERLRQRNAPGLRDALGLATPVRRDVVLEARSNAGLDAGIAGFIVGFELSGGNAATYFGMRERETANTCQARAATLAA